MKSTVSSPYGLLVAHSFMGMLTALIVASCWGTRDIEKAMAFYGVYHSHPVNQLIHFFGVPLISLTTLMVGSMLPLTSSIYLRLPWTLEHNPTWSTLLSLIYAVYYVSIDPVGATLYFPVLYWMYATSVQWVDQDRRRADSTHAKDKPRPGWAGSGRLIRQAIILHLLGWYVQIHPGHRVLEGSQPAIFDSIGGALTSAPLFAFYEGVWLAGFRKDLQQQVLVRVEKNRVDLCAAGVKVRGCEEM